MQRCATAHGRATAAAPAPHLNLARSAIDPASTVEAVALKAQPKNQLDQYCSWLSALASAEKKLEVPAGSARTHAQQGEGNRGRERR